MQPYPGPTLWFASLYPSVLEVNPPKKWTDFREHMDTLQETVYVALQETMGFTPLTRVILQ